MFNSSILIMLALQLSLILASSKEKKNQEMHVRRAQSISMRDDVTTLNPKQLDGSAARRSFNILQPVSEDPNQLQHKKQKGNDEQYHPKHLNKSNPKNNSTKSKQHNSFDWQDEAKHLLFKSAQVIATANQVEKMIQHTEEINATRVGVGISFKYISNIDSVNQMFTVNFLLRYQWHLTKQDNQKFEQLLRHNSVTSIYHGSVSNIEIESVDDEDISNTAGNININSDINNNINNISNYPRQPSALNSVVRENGTEMSATIDFKPSNEPEFIFPNLIETLSMRRVKISNQYYWKPEAIKHPLLIESGYEILGTFSEPLELHQFPFDCQELPIVIESVKNSKHCMLLPEFTNESFVKFRRRFSAIPEWDILEPFAEFRKTLPSKSRAKSSFWQFILKLRVRRQLSCTASVYICFQCLFCNRG